MKITYTAKETVSAIKLLDAMIKTNPMFRLTEKGLNELAHLKQDLVVNGKPSALLMESINKRSKSFDASTDVFVELNEDGSFSINFPEDAVSAYMDIFTEEAEAISGIAITLFGVMKSMKCLVSRISEKMSKITFKGL